MSMILRCCFCWEGQLYYFVHEAALFCFFFIISNAVIHFNFNYCLKMIPIVARWLVDWFGVLCSVTIVLLSYWLREVGVFDPAAPHCQWRLVKRLIRRISYSLLRDDSLIESYYCRFIIAPLGWTDLVWPTKLLLLVIKKSCLLWPGPSQWRIYYHRMWGQLSTTCSNYWSSPVGIS